MTWLNGVPLKVRKLAPAEDSGLKHRGTSILDKRILQFFEKPGGSPDAPPQIVVYVADLQDDAETPSFEKIADTSLQLSRIELLPTPADSSDQEFFASAEWKKRSLQLILRTHARTGRILKETSMAAAAAYGNLAVGAGKLAFCISSGNAPSDMPEFYHGLRDITRGIRLDRNFKDTESVVPDQIVVWDYLKLRVHIIKIFQDTDSPVLHSASMGFIGPDTIALAGQIESTYGMDAALLQCYSITSVKDAYSRTFAQGQHTSRNLIYREIGKAGSSQNSAIFLHVHDGSRISIFNRDLLTGQIFSSPTSYFPSFHEATVHRSYHRCIWGSVNNTASFAGDRILIVTEPDPEISDDMSPIAWILDFNQQRVKDLVNLSEYDREALKSRLEEEKAQVRVVTRRFHINSVGEEVDQEFPYPTSPSGEWFSHLEKLYEEKVDRLEEEIEPPALAFEEPPEEHRGDVLFGYIETKVQCPEGVDPYRLAITSSTLIYIPQETQQKGWLIFDFDDQLH